MVCNHCGFDNPNDSNTCANCGNYLGENSNPYAQSNQYEPNQWQQQQYNQQPYYGQQFDDTTPLRTSQYIGMILLQAIPIVGIIMLFVWAFSKPNNVNRRNYARASLIIAGIVIGIYIALFIIVAAIGIAIGNSLYY